GLVESMVIGTRALMYSAEFYEEDIEDESESFFEKIFKDKSETAEIVFSLLFSLLITIVVFMAGPMFLTGLIKKTVKNPIALNLIEGFIRIVFFLIYVIAISKMEDVERVFEYHGAEHKTIHCYENEEELT